MKLRLLSLFLVLLTGCLPHPGRLGRLPEKSNLHPTNFSIPVSGGGKILAAQYLGCGGLYLQQDGAGILIDPFFSNQGIWRLTKSVLSKNGRKRIVRSDRKTVDFAIGAIEKETGPLSGQVEAIFTAHSHYDHLMDVPAVFNRIGKGPTVYVSESGYNIVGNVIDRAKLQVLENHMTTQETVRLPIVVQLKNGKKVNVYPILADHNPHFNNIKVFDGSTQKSVDYFKQPYDRTRANDWLEGATFSFVIDYLDATGAIELRVFVQSSSCNPPAGIPPLAIRQMRNVDVAFLGVASYSASPDYPENVLKILAPGKVVWIHWEDFFRSYKKNPKTVRATDVSEFFNKEIPPNPSFEYYTPWPRVRMDIHY